MRGRGRQLSADALKLIAVLTMIIDHIGAGILFPMLRNGSFGTARSAVYQVYWTSRFVGRLAFPIYCYLLMLGFLYTRSRVRYMGRMFLFVLLSEIPFDYLFHGGFTNEYQNVFWTLLLGLVGLWGEELLLGNGKEEYQGLIYRIFGAVLACGSIAAGYFLHTDYGWKGVLLILVIYLFRRDRASMCIAAPTVFLLSICIDLYAKGTELDAILNNLNLQWSVYLAFYLILICNGKRKIRTNLVKWAAYYVYPVHLCVLLLIQHLLMK